MSCTNIQLVRAPVRSDNSFELLSDQTTRSSPGRIRQLVRAPVGSDNSFEPRSDQTTRSSPGRIRPKTSPRFLCRLTALIKLLVAVQRQRVLYTEIIEFASPAIGSAHFHVSWLSDFIFNHKPYINRFTNHFSIHS